MIKNKLVHLTLGELKRLNKYHVTTVSIGLAFIWFLLLFFIDDQDILAQMLPLVIIVDTTMMSMIYVGAVMFFEKTEKTISTMLVSPVKKSDIVLSKVIANTIFQTLSTLLLVMVFYVVKGIDISIVLIIMAMVISVVFHTLLGFVFSYHSKDFTSMLVNVMMYAFLISFPAFFYQFELIFKGDFFKYFLVLSPTQSSFNVISLGFLKSLNLEIYLSLFLLIIGSVFLYLFYVLPKYKDYAVRESGV